MRLQIQLNWGVVRAGCVAMQRIKPHRRIVSTSREAEERIFFLRGVLVWIASVRCWIDGANRRRKRKAAERDDDQEAREQKLKIGRCFHG